MEQVPAKKNSVVFIYFLIIAIDSISFGLIGPIIAPLLAKSSIFFSSVHSIFLHYLIYGILISLFSLAFMIAAPILGYLSDHFGRKKILFFCLVIALIAFFIYAIAFILKNIFLFMMARLLAGISAGSQGVAQAAVVDFAKQHEKPLVVSTIAIGMTMGLIVGPLLASIWTHAASWLPFVIVMGLSFIALLLLTCIKSSQKIYSTKHIKNAFSTFVKKPGTVYLLTLFFLFELGWSLYYQSLPLWLGLHWHMKNPELGFINSYVGTLLAICLYFGCRIGSRFVSLPNLIQCSFALGVIALFLLIFKNSLLYFLILALPIVFAVAIIYPGLIALLSELCSPEQQGLMMGTTDALLAFAFAVTGLLSSILMYLNPFLPFLAASLCWIAAAIGTYQSRRTLACNSVSM